MFIIIRLSGVFARFHDEEGGGGGVGPLKQS